MLWIERENYEIILIRNNNLTVFLFSLFGFPNKASRVIRISLTIPRTVRISRDMGPY